MPKVRHILIVLAGAICSLPSLLFAAPITFGQVTIPRIATAPALEEFIDMKPSPAWKGKAGKDRPFYSAHFRRR